MGTALRVGKANVARLAAIGTIILTVFAHRDVVLTLAEHAEALTLALPLRPVALGANDVSGHRVSPSKLFH
jgi:hypothetical protein